MDTAPQPPSTPSPGAPGDPSPLVHMATRVQDTARSQWARRSVTLKLFAIGLLTLVLLVPLLLLRGLISEREQLRDEARSELSGKWGGPQRIGGPVLTVPLTRPVLTAAQVAAQANTPGGLPTAVHFLPDDLDVSGTVEPEVRRRGIHEVVLYTSRLRVQATFPRPSFEGIDLAGGTPDLARAYVQIGIPDMVGVKDAIAVSWNGARTETSPGIPSGEVFRSGVHATVAVSADSAQRFETTLVIGGARQLTFLPFGKETRVALTSPWKSPSTIGAFLADTLSVTPSGFLARWKVLHLNRNYGQRFTGPFAGIGSGPEVDLTPRYESTGDASTPDGAFGVELLQGIDSYRKTMRTAEYGLLFVLLTFGTFFFIEVLGGRRVHPVQYLLVGTAVCLFYLMLLAFSEYVVFDVAYLAAAAAILALVLLYAKAIFDSWRLAGLVAGVLAVFYLYFYVLLNLEDLALLIGSIGLFAILAGVMYLSRRVDWYGMTGKDAAAAAAP